MQLTRFTDFGLRMLMYLSKHDRTTPITIAEIAGQFEIPHNHLIKVANRLGKLGLVKALRGRNGGLVLAVVLTLVVALHELGHALGIGHIGPPLTAIMNPIYAGVRTDLAPLDHAALCSVWGSWPK